MLEGKGNNEFVAVPSFPQKCAVTIYSSDLFLTDKTCLEIVMADNFYKTAITTGKILIKNMPRNG